MRLGYGHTLPWALVPYDLKTCVLEGGAVTSKLRLGHTQNLVLGHVQILF